MRLVANPLVRTGTGRKTEAIAQTGLVGDLLIVERRDEEMSSRMGLMQRQELSLLLIFGELARHAGRQKLPVVFCV